PSGGPAPPATKQTAAEPVIKVMARSGAKSAAMSIDFPSTDAVGKVGIEVGQAKFQALTRTVTAPGTVDYEPGRYARLSARTPGTVWRVYKEIGDSIQKGEVLALLDSAELGKTKADFLMSLTQL